MANLINGALSGVSRAAGVVSGATSKLANKAANTLTARTTLPGQIYLADLFRWKLFSKVDFDSVIGYLRTNHILKCENIYTLKSLAYGLLPKVTYDALKRRNPKRVLGLFALTGKLCMRRKKGLLCYIDISTGYAKKIFKFDDFLTCVDLPDNIQQDNLWIPIEVAFPKLKQRVALQQAQVATENQSSSTTVAEQTTIAAQAPRFLETLPQLDTPRHLEQNQTGIFSRNTIDPVEIFLSEYQVLSEEQNVNPDKPFDSLLFALLNMVLQQKPSEDINKFVQEVSELFALAGVNDFTLALQQTRGDLMSSFRRLYSLPEGDGSSNTLFQSAVFNLWEKQTGSLVSNEPSLKYLDLRTRLFTILRMKAEQAAEEAARAAEQEVQDRLTELSQTIRSPLNAEDIIL